MKWKTLASREVYKNPWIRVREDDIIHPSGKKGIYGVVEIPSGVFVVALNKKKKILMIKQLRYCTNIFSWELPGGGLKPKNSILKQGKEELREEARVSAKNFKILNKTQTQPGITTQIDYLLKADITGLTKKDYKEEQLKEGINEVGYFSLKEIKKMILNGEINHGQSITAIFLYELSLINK
jgi:ADP-ribose pyrophosphatase YjhB (NUDIX family)